MSSDDLGTLRGHDPILAGLWRAACENRLPHALLFEGPDGVGKFLAARHLAAGLLCETGPAIEADGQNAGRACGICGPCKRFASATHPDVLVIDPGSEGEEILKLNRIADRDDSPDTTVGGFLSLKAGEGGFRVVILRDAELMNAPAQNALLKTLEEPAARVLLVLVTGRPRRLLETVRSRCVSVSFSPLTVAETEDVLVAMTGEREEMGFPERGPRRELLMRWGRGAPGRVLVLMAKGMLPIRDHLAALLCGEDEPGACNQALGEVRGVWGGKTASAQGRDRVRVVLGVALELLGELIEARGGTRHPGACGSVHGDALEGVRPASDALRRWQVDQLLSAVQDVEANMNTDAIMDRSLWALARRELDEGCLAAPGSGGWAGKGVGA